MGCAMRKFRKMEQRIIELEKERDDLLSEIEALKASVIVGATGPQVYPMIANAVVFKGHSPSDVKYYSRIANFK